MSNNEKWLLIAIPVLFITMLSGNLLDNMDQNVYAAADGVGSDSNGTSDTSSGTFSGGDNSGNSDSVHGGSNQ